jgi:hypothetical protein
VSDTIFGKDDRVALAKPLGPCSPGDEGNVQYVDAKGNVTVKITHRNPGCTPFVFLLPPTPPDYFREGGVCTGVAGQVGKTFGKKSSRGKRSKRGK